MTASVEPKADLRSDLRRTGSEERYRTAVFLGVLAAAAYLVIVIFAVSVSSYDTWGGLVIAPFLFFLGAPILRRLVMKVEPDQWIRQVIFFGYAAKLLSSYARFYTNEYILGKGDAFIYHQHASAISAEFRQFIFGGPAYQEAIADLAGTEFIRLLLSLVYMVTGPTRLGGFVVFSFMSFWGLYLFYRAYSIAMPDGLNRRYAVLVFFLPSMLFWPSSVGKEAWMTTMLGLGSYGLARLLTQRRFAYLPILASLAGLGIVRPHVAAIFGAGLMSAFVLRRSTGSGKTTKKILGLVVMAIAAGLLLSQLQSFFGLEEGLDAQDVFERTTERSAQGGSQFDAAQPTTVTGLPWAIVTVLFRPFLYEAGSAAGLFTALEGTVLLVLFMWNAPRLARLPALIISKPYVGYVVIYSLIFTFAFSAVSNFGILARQRTQLFPMVAVVLTLPIEGTPRTRGLRAGGGLHRGLRSAGPARSDPEDDTDTDYEQAGARRPVGPRFIG